MSNKIRGEVDVKVGGGKTYTLKPEHSRAVALDDALRKGIIGTLVDSGTKDTMKVRDVATIIHYLADDAPSIDTLMKEVLKGNLYEAAVTTALALANVAGGSDEGNGEGEAEEKAPAVAPSKKTTKSTSTSD